MRDVGGERVSVARRLCERAGEMEVHEPPTRRREARERGASQEIMREVERPRRPGGAEDAVALEVGDRRDEIGWRCPRGAGDELGIEGAADGRRPRRDLARDTREPLQAFVEDLAEGARERAAVRAFPREVDGVERVAAALGGDARGVGVRVDAPRQRLGVVRLERSEIDDAKLAGSPEPTDEPERGGVVVELSRPRGGHEEHAPRRERAHRRVEQRRRGVVDPLEVVDQDGERARLGEAPEQIDHRVEELLAMGRRSLAAGRRRGDERAEG